MKKPTYKGIFRCALSADVAGPRTQMIVYGDFEWSMRDAATNLARHGVSFKEAATVFADPARVQAGDGAAGRTVTGLSSRGRALVVVYEPGSRSRLLSAQPEGSDKRAPKAPAHPEGAASPTEAAPIAAPPPVVPPPPPAVKVETDPYKPVPASKVGYVTKRPARHLIGQLPLSTANGALASNSAVAPSASVAPNGSVAQPAAVTAKADVAPPEKASSASKSTAPEKPSSASKSTPPEKAEARAETAQAPEKAMTEEERIAEEDRAHRASRAQQTAKARAAAAAKRAERKAAAEAAAQAEAEKKATEAAKTDSAPRSERRPKPQKPSTPPPEAAPKSSRSPRISWREAARQAMAKLQ